MSAPPDSARDRLGQIAVDVQRRLEAFYALDPEAPVTDYLVAPGEVAHLPGGGSRTLVAQEGDEVSVGVVLDEAIGAHLEKSDPRERLDSSNLGAFSTLTEEVSHFLYLLFRARSERQVTQLELELQAEVDKYLTALFFLSLQNEGAVSTRLRHAALPPLPAGGGPLRGERGALPRGVAPREPLLRLARGAVPAEPPPPGPGPRSAAVLAARAEGEARDDRGATLRRRMERRPIPGPSAEEQRRADRLRRAVDVACAVLRQGRLTRAEGEAVVALAREQVLALFPGKGDVFDLVLAPRFAPHPGRVLPGRHLARVLPFRRA